MNKKLLEEINKINFLNNYEIGKTLNEQRGSDSENILLEKKEKSVGVKIGGGHSNLMDKTRGYVDLSANFVYDENLELSKPINVIAKMNQELSDEPAYNALNGEQRTALGEAFYYALEQIQNDPRTYAKQAGSREEKKDIKKLKKFLKKSQRWEFIMDDEVIPSEYKSVPISVVADVQAEELNDLKNAINENLKQDFDNECKPEYLLSNQQQVFAGNDEEGTMSFATIAKPMLSFVFSYQSENIKAAQLRDESKEAVSSFARVEIPQLQLTFDPGKADATIFKDKVMKHIYDTLYKTEITYQTPKKDTETKTIGEMIECNRTMSCEMQYKIEITSLSVTSSASNTWTGTDVLKYSLTNDGEYTTDCHSYKELVSMGGNDSKNALLARDRANSLANVIKAQLSKNTDVLLGGKFSDQVTLNPEVTDTGGKLDKVSGMKPGQYAEFSLGVSVTAIGSIKRSAQSELTGEIANKCIRLNYIGSNFGWTVSLNWGDSVKAERINRGVFGGDNWMSYGRMNSRMKQGDRDYARKTNTTPAYKQNRQRYGKKVKTWKK
jgi:hypothetical protein